jgi:Flp pilus assembly pilin Flp
MGDDMIRLIREEAGAAASEYAILVSLIAVAIAVAVIQFDLTGLFPAVAAKVLSAMG